MCVSAMIRIGLYLTAFRCFTHLGWPHTHTPRRQWEQVDRRYQLTRKFEAVKALSLKKWREAGEAERKYELRFRLKSALKATYNGAIDATASLFNAKDRRVLVKKLPKPLRYLFMSKAQRRMDE